MVVVVFKVSLPGQGTASSSVEQIVDTQVPGRGNSGGVGARSLQRTSVQFTDFPVPGAGGGLHGFLSGSIHRALTSLVEITITLVRASSLVVVEEEEEEETDGGCSSVTPPRASPVTGTDAPT